MPRLATPALQGQKRPCDEGNNASNCRQQQWRGAGNDASACRDCFVTGKTQGCNAGGKAKVMRTKMPAQQGQKHPATR
jgi:hypothetical protein